MSQSRSIRGPRHPLLRARTATVLAVLACAGWSGCATPPEQASLATLRGTWQHVGLIQGSPVPAGCKIPTISFGPDGRFSGMAGINRYRGELDMAALGDHRFHSGPIATTRMAGPQEAMRFENQFLSALERTDQAWVERGQLVLRRGEQEILRFARVSSQ